jgi:putative hydrolase of the HAD superfamily
LTIKAILFDLDDTLYEEKQFVKSGFKKVTKFINNKFNIDEKIFYKILTDVFNEGIRGNIFNIVLGRFNIKHNPKIKLDKDVRSLLIKLRGIYSLGIITDGYYEVQKKKVQALKLEELFDSIIYTDRYGREFWKPNLFSYELALKDLQISPEETIYIGDNPYKDFIGAKKVGISTVRVLFKGREYSKVRLDKEYEADYEVEKLNEIMNLLKKF